MPDALNPETRQQMRELCNKISVAHDLDEAVQEELLGHMEDKFLAYLSGDEPVSEQDAFILVREHFGDPATIKTLMQDAHPGPVRASLARRIGAALIALSAVEFFLHWAFLPVAWLIYERQMLNNSWAVNTFSVLFFIAPVPLFWALLLRWQRMMSVGKKPWFLKVRPSVFMYVSILLVALWILPTLGPFRLTPAQAPQYQPPNWFTYLLTYGCSIPSCLLWLWWCDTPPRTIPSMGAAVAAWLVSSIFQRAGYLAGAFIAMYASMGSVGDHSSEYQAQLLWQSSLVLPNGKDILFRAAAPVGLYLLFRLARRPNKTLPLTN